MPCASESPLATHAPDALYRQFFHRFADELYVHDQAGTIVDVNAAACTNLGYPREALIGMAMADICTTLDASTRSRLQRKDGSTYHLDMHLDCQEVAGTAYFLALGRHTQEDGEEERQGAIDMAQLNTRLETLVQERTKLWRESTRLLNAVMQQTPDAIFIKDLQGRYIYGNDALARQLQLPVPAILGKTDMQLYPPAQAQDFARTDLEVLQRDAPCVYEDRLQTSSGLFFANTMKMPHRDEAGRVVGILGISRNVSEVRSAQEQVTHNYAMLRQAERAAKIGSWTLELSSNIFTASEMLVEMNGLKPGDPPLTPQSLAAMIEPAQHAVLSAAINQCIQAGTPYTVDVQHQRPGGGTFPARIRGQAFRDAGGKITMLHGTLQDLSDHLEADQRLQTLADNLPNGAIFRCEQSLEGRLILRYVSAGIQRLLGISAPAFLAQQTRFTSLIVQEDKAIFFTAVQRSLQTGTAFDLVSRVRNSDGQLRWMRTRAAPRTTHQGMLWEGILLDVTTEYEVQESLHQAKEAAESAERAKSEFLATMSHEIRTPMNTVIGMTQLLLQTPVTTKQRNYLDKVSLSTTALLKIINEILDFSKLEADMLHIDPVPFLLDELLESVSTVTGLRAEQKGVEMAYNIAPSVPRHLLGDLQRLSQVLTNLVGNAIKFTERGEVVVSMHALPEPHDARSYTLHVTVRDTGIGIHPEHMAQLFKPFMQAEAHTSRRFGGTGLGLAISQKLVQLMGGKIQAHSQLGQGSSFSFHVCLQAQTDATVPQTWAGSPCRVLVVDDNLMARDMLCAMVRDWGLDGDIACSGPEALALLHTANHQQRPFQLVLMDWKMPGMDGLQVVERIRQDTALSHTPAIVMVTASCRDEVLERAAQWALQGLLIKPVTASALFNAMQEALPPASLGIPARDLGHPEAALHIPATLRGRRVLVVDDNGLNREVAQDFLELAGVQVTTAESGPQALDYLQTLPFDAVLLDVQMPEMDGLEVARRIRQDPRLQQLPVWALTAQTQLADRQAIVRSGMNGQLTKPINAQILFQTLEQALAPLAPLPSSTAHAAQAAPTGFARHFQGHADRMQRLLRAFVRDFAASPAQLASLHSAQDWPALGRLAHTLKGALGYLDQAAAVQAMAQVELACRRGEAVPAPLVSHAAQQLQQVIEEIQHMHSSALDRTTAPTPPTLDHPQLLALIEQARPAIQRSEYAGVRSLEQLETLLRGTPLHGLAARALALSEDLEADAACHCLLQLQHTLSSHLPDGTPSDGPHAP